MDQSLCMDPETENKTCKTMNIIKSVFSRFKYYRNIIRSYAFCFRYLPYNQAKRMPFYLTEPIDILELRKGNIILKGEIRPRMIWIGGGVELGQKRGLILEINEGGHLIFEGSAFIANGCYIRVHEGAKMILGDKIGVNSTCFIRSTTEVTLGERVMLGWDNEIIDSDGHDVWVDDHKVVKSQPIHIGKHVWITSHVRISKGVTIADECIVAKGAIVTKSHTTPHTLIGGVPAKEIRNNVKWEK